MRQTVGATGGGGGEGGSLFQQERLLPNLPLPNPHSHSQVFISEFPTREDIEEHLGGGRNERQHRI